MRSRLGDRWGRNPAVWRRKGARKCKSVMASRFDARCRGPRQEAGDQLQRRDAILIIFWMGRED